MAFGFNLKKNIWFSIGEFAVNIALIFASYRLVILNGGIEILGLWSVLFAWTSLIRIGDAGMANATLRFVALFDIETQSHKIRTYVETAFIANTVLFLLLALAGHYLLSNNIESVVSPENSAAALGVIPAMFISFFLFNISNIFLGSIQGLHLGYVRSIISVAGNGVQLIFVLILVPKYGIWGLAVSQIIQHFLVICTGWILVRRYLRTGIFETTIFNFSAFREMLNFSIRAQIANISNGLIEPFSKIIVGHFAGLTALGLFELAYKTVWLPRNVVVAGTTATIPAMTSMLKFGKREVREVYQKALKYTCFGVGVLLVLVISATPVISWLWLGEANYLYVQFVAILACGVFLNSLGAAAYNLATVTGIMRNNILVNISVLCILIAGGFVAGNFFPQLGPVVASAVGIGIGGIWIKSLNERLLKNA